MSVMNRGFCDGLGMKLCERNLVKRTRCSFGPNILSKRRLYSNNTKLSRLSVVRRVEVSCRRGSDCSVDPLDVEKILDNEEEVVSNTTEEDIAELVENHAPPNVKKELIVLTLPALAGQIVEPFSQLMETAFIGRLGPVELASAGVSISIFNIISKLFNIPLLSIATSFVAEDIAKTASSKSFSDDRSQEERNSGGTFSELTEKKQLPSVSTALLLAVGIGLFEAVALYLGSGLFLNVMGITSASPMRIPANRFLSLRALGAPAVVVSLALQGVFRGFKDTTTPSLCLGVGNLSSIILLPLFMYTLRLGVIGAAIATVISQYAVTFLMIWQLSKRVILLPPKMENLHFGGYLKSGGFLIGRTLAILMTMTLGTSMAARQGPLAMAAHQICLQVWLAVSLLTDALAASGQAMIATSFSKRDYKSVKKITFFLLKTGLFAGVFLAILLGASFGSLATLFTKDPEVLGIVRSLVLFVSATQPINALAFIADGLYYGVSDFAYAAQSMIIVGAISSAFFVYVSPIYGISGVWCGLTLCMGLRMLAGYIRLMSKSGPWWFLHADEI
ncbi:Protein DETOXIFICATION 45 [Ranunculus cassubicifolius]